MARAIFSCPNTPSIMPRSAVPSPQTRRRFSLGRRRIDSDPHQPPLWIQAMGQFPWGRDTRPPVRTNPRKSSVPYQGPSVPRRRGREAGVRDPQRGPSASAPRPRRARGFTERWLAARRASSNPSLARWQGRLGHGQSSMAIGRGCAGARSRLGGVWPTPYWRSPAHPQIVQAKARPTSKSVPSRKM